MSEEIEQLMFKKTNDMLELDKYTLLDIIKALQFDRRYWINQYTTIHNDYVNLQQELTKYKERNEKAVEYIKLHRKTFSLGVNEEIDEFDYISTSPKALLEILEDKENK